ncbi:unnamed protein product [Somion occarium]|uniref:Uncharacterized protein n=1 Tax=Somion occarium TaxID=3059160 RepID=A0ABP1CLL1_9APHY
MLNFNLATTCTCPHALLAYVALGCLRVVQRILLPITSFSVGLMNVPIQRHDSCSLHASRTTILSSWSWRVAFFNCMASLGLMWEERRSSWYCAMHMMAPYDMLCVKSFLPYTVTPLRANASRW